MPVDRKADKTLQFHNLEISFLMGILAVGVNSLLGSSKMLY